MSRKLLLATILTIGGCFNGVGCAALGISRENAISIAKESGAAAAAGAKDLIAESLYKKSDDILSKAEARVKDAEAKAEEAKRSAAALAAKGDIGEATRKGLEYLLYAILGTGGASIAAEARKWSRDRAVTAGAPAADSVKGGA